MTKSTMYQTGTIHSLIEMVYHGDTSIAELKQHGDFGLGTVDLVDGELIVCDNHYYRADVNGKLSIVDNHIKSPFAVINKFVPETKVDINNLSSQELKTLLEKQFVSPNLIYAIKITGSFKDMKLRSETCQSMPFRKLSETLPELQNAFTLNETDGVIVCTWFPDYLQQVNVSGFHFHFVDSKREIGGHVFSFSAASGLAEIQTLKSFQMDMIDSNAFYKANLDVHTSDAVSKIERNH